jgi:hypothetical protein
MGRMRLPIRLFAPLLLIPLLSGCSDGTRHEAAKAVPPMNKNCEWLQHKFDDMVKDKGFCKGLTPRAVMSAQPKIVGAVLQSVFRNPISVRGYKKQQYRYDFLFRSRTNRFEVTVVSPQKIDFQKDSFYSVDLMNTCRFEAMLQVPAPAAQLMNAFKLPNKLSCL